MTPLRCLVFLGCFSLGLTGNPSCLPVKKLYKAKNFSVDDVPTSAVDGKELKVCASSSDAKYCCTKQMERHFEALSRGDFEKAVGTKTDKILLKGLFSKKHKEFDDYFQSLIKQSRQNLDTMFKNTYKGHYSQNKDVFMDLFVELEKYYTGGKNSDLEQVVQNFFEKVMGKMFEILTRQSYSANFMGCVTKHMKELKPFGDIPEQLKHQVKKAFVIARTFTQALEVGRDMASELGKISATTDCQKHLVKMSYCSWCRPQYISLKPCNGFCVDVYKSCLADLTQVNPHWDAYLKALVEIVAKFVGPMSIENVLGELHMKISTGIMNCQDILLKDQTKITEGCKKFIGKHRRSLESDNDFFLEDTIRERREAMGGKSQDRGAGVSRLERMSLDFKQDMKVAPNFWNLLPDAICKMPDIAAGVQSNECWNGTMKGRYSGSGVPNKVGSTMSQQITQLKVIMQQLKSALEGEDVNVIDPEESGDGSGSASGSGSGNKITTDFSSPSPNGGENEIDDESESDDNGGNDNNNELALEGKNKNNSGMAVLPSMWLLYVVICISRCI